MAVQMRTMLEVADNSGARKLQVILPLGGSSGKKAGLGDVVTAAVKEASPDGTVKKGKVVKVLEAREDESRLTDITEDIAREVATLNRFRLYRNSIPRGASSGEDVVSE